jgi:hypothetical protein
MVGKRRHPREVMCRAAGARTCAVSGRSDVLEFAIEEVRR